MRHVACDVSCGIKERMIASVERWAQQNEHQHQQEYHYQQDQQNQHQHTHTLAHIHRHTHTHKHRLLNVAAAPQSVWFSMMVPEDSESKQEDHDNERKTWMQDVLVQQKSESLFSRKEKMQEGWGMQLVV